jgi:hypothetical protein
LIAVGTSVITFLIILDISHLEPHLNCRIFCGGDCLQA